MIKTASLAFIVAITFSLGLIFAGEDKKLVPEQIPSYLQDISVTVHASNSQGSGVMKTRDGTTYILTAAHVIANLRKVRPIIDTKTGNHRAKIEFADAKVIKEIYDDDRSVGHLSIDAEIIRYSDANNGEDLALLRLRKNGLLQYSAKFDNKGSVAIGTELLHVGSLLGQEGSNSLTSGIVSQHGRVLRGIVYDQSTCAAFPGSSGGGIYRKSDASYIGMIVRGSGETYNLYVPMRRIKKWADRVGVSFVLDDSLPVPTEKQLRSMPVEEVGEEPKKESQTIDIEDLNFLIKKDKDPVLEKKARKITIEWR